MRDEFIRLTRRVLLYAHVLWRNCRDVVEQRSSKGIGEAVVGARYRKSTLVLIRPKFPHSLSLF